MPRLVRRQRQTPQARFKDALLALHEEYEMIDFDSLSARWSAPIGLVLNLSFWLCCLNVSSKTRLRSGRSARMRTPWISWSALWIWMMVMLSLSNFVYLLTRRRTYSLRQPGTTQSIPPSTSGSPAGVPFFSKHNPDASTLTAWEPALPSLRFFCVLSPLHLLLTWQGRGSSWTALTLLLLSATLFMLVTLFLQHVKDKQSLYGHVFSEYEQTFVAPRLSILKRDVGCGTAPDAQGVYVEVHTPKVGIISGSQDLPRSASRVRMHEWDRPGTGPGSSMGLPSTPLQSPIKRSATVGGGAGLDYHARARTVQSPLKQQQGQSPMKPAGWRPSTPAGSLAPTLGQPQTGQQAGLGNYGGLRRSGTSRSLLRE